LTKEVGPLLIPYTKVYLKWNIYLKGSSKTIHLEENIGVNLHDLGLATSFLDIIPKAQTTKKLDKLKFIKVTDFCALRETSRP